MKVILCGYNWCGCKALNTLISQGHDVFVFTHMNPYYVPSVIDTCKKLKAPYSIENISRVRLPFTPDVICSIFYRYMIEKPIIDCYEGRIFNLHPSLLPKYRGCSSITWAMVNDEPEVGFSYHYIDEGCDTGPILLQKHIKIEEWDTQQSLYMRVMFESMSYFQEVFDMVVAGATGLPQTGEASHYPRECPYGGEIDQAWKLDEIERFIRAMNYPPYPPARFDGKTVHSIDEYLLLISGGKPVT
jgi:methionyl-tRNA formyltransferase